MAPRNNIVTVEATTETLSYIVKNSELSLMNVVGAQLFVDPFSDAPELHVESQGSYFRPSENVRIRITKQEGAGTAYVSMTSDGESVGSLFFGDNSMVLGPWAVLKFATSSGDFLPLVIPFRGQLTLGEDVAPGVDAILLAGSVSIAEEQLGLFNQERYLLQTTDLEQGDRIRILPKDAADTVLSDGFIRISGDNAASIVAHTNNCVVHVVRFGSAGYKISPSAWARLTNDPGLSWLTALLGVLLLSTELILALSSFFNSKLGQAQSGDVDDADRGKIDESVTESYDRNSLGNVEAEKDEQKCE